MKVNMIRLLVICSLLIIRVQSVHPLHGLPCKSDSDCLDGGYEYCKFHTDEGALKGFCQHKDPFPMLLMEVLGIIAV